MAEPGWANNVIAGASAGLITSLALYPLDLVKTRLQVQDNLMPSSQYRSTWHALCSIVHCEGYRGLFAGLTPSLVGSGVAWGLYYSIYHHLKRSDKSGDASWHRDFVHGLQTGAVVSLITNPIWVLKTRMQLQKSTVLAETGTAGAAVCANWTTPRYKGAFDAIQQITRQEGPLAFFRGLGPQMLLVSHSAIQFMAYDQFKQLLRRATPTTGPAPANQDRFGGQLDAALAGALSKLCAASCTYPLQVLKSRLQQRQDPTRGFTYTTARQALRVTFRREGVRGLYRGLGTQLMRTMPQSALQFYVFETVLKTLQRLHTLRAPVEAER